MIRMTSVASGFLLVMTSAALLGCGGDDAPAPATDQTATTQTGSAPAAAPAASGDVVAPPSGTLTPAMQAFNDDGDVAEIVIEGDDMIRFSLDRFSVRPGQMVRIRLNHVGSLPAQAMGHNVVVIQQGEDVYEFGADVGMAGGSAANDFVPESMRDRVVAFTPMIGGGQSAVVEFQAPTETGDYPFLCSFPGHFAQMNGTMAVE